MGRKSTAKKKRKQQGGGKPTAPAEAAPKAPKERAPGTIHVSDAGFDHEVVHSEIPVVVDFWAPWCGPCKMVAPILDELAVELHGKVKIVKYNTEKNQRVAQALNVRSIPTMVVFRDGEVADVRIGASPRPVLEKWVRKWGEPKRSLLSKLFG